MKRLLYFLMIGLMVAGFTSCNGKKTNGEKEIPMDVINNPKTASGDENMDELPKIEFEETLHDFGKVIEGEIVTYAFKFKNTGGSDLLITSVSTSCGCTVSDFPKEPIKPGDEGVVKLSFDSSGRKGFQHKTANVLANTQPNLTKIGIKAMVINPEKDNF